MRSRSIKTVNAELNYGWQSTAGVRPYSIRVPVQPAHRGAPVGKNWQYLQERREMTPKRLSFVLTFVALLAIATFCTAPPPALAQSQPSLYHRLGGYDVIAAVTDDFVGRLATDPQLNRFFTGLSVDSQKKLRQHVVDFLCNATGGPCLYTGRDMKTAHTGLGITETDWDSSVKHLVATLDKFKVPEKEKNEVLGAISGLKGDIVGR
jgi:hemoglobin